MSRVALVSTMFAATLLAQNYGEITGTITDQTGAVISDASVTITNAATNQVRHLKTNPSGTYSMPFLVPGTYNVDVSVQGFKSVSRHGIDLQVGAVQRIDFTLQVGEVGQKIDVSESSPVLATENAAVGTVIDNRRVVELPLNGRNYLQLVKLSTNVTGEMGAGGEAATRVGGERANQAISVAGQRQQFNNYTLDGIENTDVAYNLFVVRPSIDALQEFKVQTGIYSAEYGRATSQISAATKSGTNGFHGAIFEFLRNDVFDAREWQQASPNKNPFRRNQFGFTLAGPIIRNKLFFLSNYEGFRDRKTTQGVASVAPDRMRAGDFSGQSRPIYDPATRVYSTDAQGNVRAIAAQPFPNNQIPINRFDPIALKLLEFYPRATVSGDNIVRNYVRNVPGPNDWDQFTQRIDWNESGNSNWFGRFSWGNEFLRQRSTFEQSAGRIDTTVYQVALSNTRLFGAAVVNEFRFGYNQFLNDNVAFYANERNVTAELGINGIASLPPVSWGLPSIGFQDGLSGFGDLVQVPFSLHDHIFQFIDNVSIVRGKHSFRFGGEFRRDRFNQVGDAFVRGQFAFQQIATADPTRRSTTGHSFADFLLGDVQLAQTASRQVVGLLRGSSIYAYAEDTWKITPRLTINLGLRYEYSQPWYDKYRGIMNLQMFDTGVTPNYASLLPGTRTPIFTRPGEGDFYDDLGFHFHDGIPVQAGDQYLGRSLVRSDRNDFGPRIGVSWSPNDKLVVRTGFGVFFAQDSNLPRFDMARNTGGRRSLTTNQEQPNMPLNDPFAPEASIFKCSNWNGPCIGPPFVLANNVARRTPYIYQWLFNVQRQVSSDTVVEVGYQGNAGHKLERLRFWNQAVMRTGPQDTRTPAQRRPWGSSYAEIQMVDNTVTSNYHALSLKLQRRFAQGLTYLAGFTWSKAIDNGSGIRPNGSDPLVPKNSYDLNMDKGLSQFHTGRRFVTSVLYELPLGRRSGQRFMDRFINGWQLGTILTLSDGTPTTIGGIGDRANLGLSNSANYPDATGISPIPEDRSANKFWDVRAFDTTNPELAYRFGNAGRNTLFTPGVIQWDFSTMKNFRIMEGHNVEFRFEAFNFANHPNWNQPALDARVPSTFGVVTSARTMREIQFGLKYLF
ncbi:MAG TPA: carboxypeptidase regulatory-like domain-containing protein [Bryobacteraceae bacterium]|nr:carboxypeptidase regulatory-like domain-containing protein [Bryobacteraceae bacterium]